MNGVVERLLESWLDRQTERRYQPAFVQLLVSDGWTVHHNTRHTSLEFGKDVIARSPDGVLHAFQLKGNPGTRVTKGEAQKLLLQMIELIELPVRPELGAQPGERHVAVFVTNGDIDEDARLHFATAAARIGSPGTSASKLDYWTRGDLLARFSASANRVWPADVEGTRQILDVLAGDGRESPDPRAIHRVISALAPDPGVSATGRTAAIASLLVVAEVIKSRWYAEDNHWALHAVTVVVAVAGLGVSETREQRDLVTGYAATALGHCRSLLAEARERGWDMDAVWAERDHLAELDVMLERRRLIADTAAVLVVAGEDLDDDLRFWIKPLLERTITEPHLWGNGAVPALLLRFWAFRRLDATLLSERALATTLRAILVAGEGGSGMSPLPSPYYDFTDCHARQTGALHLTDSGIEDDTFGRRQWFARAMFMMLAKRNLKTTCGQLWALHSRQSHEEPLLPAATFFSPERTREGNVRLINLMTGFWHDILEEALDTSQADFLTELSDHAWLIAAYVALVPYRAWTPVLMWLDGALDRTWYHAGHRPG